LLAPSPANPRGANTASTCEASPIVILAPVPRTKL
jgi:hypothetical protein